ncbi:MAG: calcium/sodium antiporter [Acidiferrobacterales bacterium]|nr:calcium/sodium antiporter [Acidiferrobacterales bacterium]
MILWIVAIIGGFAVLVWSADRFVVGAAALARNHGVSPLIIGLTIVGLGTSAPEMLVSAIAAWDGSPGVGIGNAIGSNITNVGLVLGATALITPLAVRSETLKREFPILFAIMLLALVLMLDQTLSRIDGIILVSGLAIMLYWLVSIGLRSRGRDPMVTEYAEVIPTDISSGIAAIWVIVGLVFMLLSSRAVVWGATGIAKYFGISDLVIGLTVVALGTSLPELAASITSAIKKEHDIAIGNVLGSNMFNLLAVLGLPGLIHPAKLDPELLSRDFPVMIVITIALFAMSYGFGRQGRISRLEGGILLGAYLFYMGWIYASSVAAG